MNETVLTVIGLTVGFVVGFLTNRGVEKPCRFCGYSEDKTEELFETEELERLLEENE